MNPLYRVILIASCLIILLLGGCATMPSGIDSGLWKLTTPGGETVDVFVSNLRDNKYYFDANFNPISGVYVLTSDSVAMEKPNNPRMTGYIWRLRQDRSLILVEEAPIELSGMRLVSSTMVGPQ